MAGVQYNLKSPAVKRLMKEASELSEATEDYYAQPLEDNLFEWHFTVRGSTDSVYANGVYHGKIIIPSEYPMRPPSIIMLTPNGRFKTNTKICLSISGHHPESWQPSWSIRTALLAIIGFMPTESYGAIGSLNYTAEERKTLAEKSGQWSCDKCGQVSILLKDRQSSSSDHPAENASERADRLLAKQICFKSSDSISDTNQEKCNPNANADDANCNQVREDVNNQNNDSLEVNPSLSNQNTLPEETNGTTERQLDNTSNANDSNDAQNSNQSTINTVTNVTAEVERSQTVGHSTGTGNGSSTGINARGQRLGYTVGIRYIFVWPADNLIVGIVIAMIALIIRRLFFL